MTYPARHISVSIDRPADEVYAFAAQPDNLPRWASGLAGKIEIVGGTVFADSPMGKVQVHLPVRNSFGVLDHDVTLPTGETFHNPMRVAKNGDGCEVIFTLYRLPKVTDEEYAKDAATITKDLTTLKQLLERR